MNGTGFAIRVLIQMKKFAISLTYVSSPQAACKIAGRNINVAVIQSMVLGCHTHCPGQVLQNTAESVALVLY
jgi:hypothetical protein